MGEWGAAGARMTRSQELARVTPKTRRYLTLEILKFIVIANGERKLEERRGKEKNKEKLHNDMFSLP
jgi:hypothetical protein